MKKLLAIILLCSGSFVTYAQNHLTIGQVYNFNVGDVFEVECGTSPSQGPPNYILTIVLAKWYSTNTDTVYYKDSVVMYTPPSCMHCTGSMSIQIDTASYTNLNSWAVQDSNPNECPSVWDTMYVDSSLYCWQKVWEQGPSKDCLDTLPVTFDGWNTTYSWLIEGCGGPYTNIFFSGNDYNDFCSLIYSKKHDTVCGAEVVITGVNQIKAIAADAKIYPNPSDGIFTITLSHAELVSASQPIIDIYNILDEKVLKEPLQTVNGNTNLDLRSQPNGVYFYRIITETGELISEGKLLIQK